MEIERNGVMWPPMTPWGHMGRQLRARSPAVKVHEEKIPMKCDFCDAEIAQKDMNKHIRSVHGLQSLKNDLKEVLQKYKTLSDRHATSQEDCLVLSFENDELNLENVELTINEYMIPANGALSLLLVKSFQKV